MILNFSRYNKVLFYNQKVIIGNVKSGYWIRITEEVYSILKYAVENSYSREELINAIQEEEDKKYINILINNMSILGLLVNEKEVIHKKVTIEITNRCNLMCNHCCISANEGKNNIEMKTYEMLQTFDKIAKWSPEIVIISGGEPLIRKDFKILLKYLRDIYEGDIYLDTNSLLINEENIEFISKNVDQINVSIDGVDETTCAIYRGKGVFEKVIKKIKLLKEYGVEKITLSMVVSEKNCMYIDKFYELNNLLGTKAIIRGLSYVGRAKKNYDILEKNDKKNVYISKEFFDDIGRKDVFYNCKAGVTDIFIRYNGEIYACPNLIDGKDNISNIKNIPYLKENEIINQEILKRLNRHKFVGNYCNQCEVKMFCWTCPAKILEFLERDSILEYCKKIKDTLRRRVWEE